MTPGELHDAVSRGVHRAVRGVGSAAESMGGLVASRFGTTGQPASQPAGGNLALAVVAALNALAGDKFGPDLAPLRIQLAVRAGNRDVDLVPGELAAAFPRPTGKLAVFVHGLAETDLSWHRPPAGHLPYGPRLHADFGYTPVYLRYNTGRHVCDNGRDLAGLLNRLLASWPVPVSDLVLVGHSMGGLVIRSACHYGTQAAASWPQQVRQIFYLGSPHLRALLTRAAGLAGVAMSKAAEARPFVTLVNGSNSGIRNLRHGYPISGHWDGCDQDSCLRDHRGDVPLLSGAEHYAISASLHHFDVLNDPAVWAAMRDILDRAGG